MPRASPARKLSTNGSQACRFRLRTRTSANSGFKVFLGIYAPDAGQKPGFNHVCFGVDAYNPQSAHTALNTAMPEAKPGLENQDQIYVQDPDGVRVRFVDVRYKR